MTTTASPPSEGTKIKFQDLFDLEEIQSIQDAFAKATGVASIITDTDGRPITKPSNFCRLCKDVIRKTEKGLNNCMYSDAVLGRGTPHGPTMQPCLSCGLWNGGASVVVDDKHIANWLIGQVRNEQQDEEAMLAYAREIGADEEAFRVALAEVNIMSTEQFSHVCQALFVMAKQLSTLAYQNVLQKRIIHERDEVEEALRESEKRFRQVAMINWVWEVDLEGRYTYCSENVIDTLGYSREEIIGKTPFDFMPQDEAIRIRRIFEELLAKRKNIVDLENWNVTKNGSGICLLTNGAPFYDKAGNLIGYRGVDKDITARRKTEEKLRASEERYRRLYKETPAMLHSIDSDGRLISVSNCWLEALGYEREEVINRRSSEFLTEESRRYAQEVILPEFFRTGYCIDVPYQFVKKNGEIMDVLLSATAEKDNKGNVTRSLAVLVDVTERKKAQAALIEAKDFAEEANQVKSEFLAKVSHEIRTPMAVFMSAIEHLLNIEKDPARLQVLNLADLSSQRLYALVEDILDFSKIEKHKLELDEETFNLRKCLQDSVNLMKVKASKKGLSLYLEISPEVPEYTFGDEFRLGQIILNLIGNAIKFTEDGGIKISVYLKKDTLIFKVKDTGIGIPEERLESVFDAFSQADGSTTRKYGGTGLGLSISKGLIELMGGRINVQSQLDKGSTFTFILPMKS